MELGLTKKVSVVLAASAGIGFGIARQLAREGCSLAICARDRERLAAARAEISGDYDVPILAEQADVGDTTSLETFFDKVLATYGTIDILVNNTGGPPPGRTEDLTDDDYRRTFELLLMSKIRACRRVLPYMRKQGWGRIINVESTSVKVAMENMALSNVFRSAAAAFAKTLSFEVAGDGVRVHTIMTGPFMTKRVEELGAKAAQDRGISVEQWIREASASMPLGRFGDPLEYGALVAFLASDWSDYLNGTCITIDGGLLKTIS